ncbi:MAG: uncharacterized protein A8A55_2557, partial [Amphiamblys sp. WSBS2006]
KIIVKENLYVLQFLKKNITATEMGFFAKSRVKALENTEITLVSGEMKSIEFGEKGLSVLPSITNKKIDVRNMAVMDIAGVFEKEEKEKAKKKEFVIRERLYMRNTGIFFLECLGNTAFIPVVKIEINHFLKKWGRFGKITGIHVETNALVGNNNDPQIKQTIREMITQKKTVVKNETGYPKLVFEEDFRHGEQSEMGKSSEQPITNYQELDLEKLIKKYTGDEGKRESKKSSEQPRTSCQASDEMLEEIHSLLQKLSDKYGPEESDYSHDEKVLGIVMNVFSEDRS